MIVSIKFESSGKRFLSGGGDGLAILWNLETGEKLLEARCGSVLVYTNFTADESRIVTLSEADGILFHDLDESGTDENSVQINRCERIEPSKRIISERGMSRCFAVSPDGSLFASLGEQDDIMIYDTKTWELRTVLDSKLDLISAEGGYYPDYGFVKFHADGQSIALISGGKFKKYSLDNPDAPASERRFGEEHSYGCVFAVSPDGSKLVSCEKGHRAVLYDTETGNVISEYPFKNKRYELRGPCFSPDGKTIAFSNNKSTLYLLDTESGESREFPMPKQDAFPLGFSPDGKILMLGVRKKLLFFDPVSGDVNREFCFKKEDVRFSMISGDGKFLFLEVMYDYHSRMQLVELESGEMKFEKVFPFPPESFSVGGVPWKRFEAGSRGTGNRDYRYENFRMRKDFRKSSG